MTSTGLRPLAFDDAYLDDRPDDRSGMGTRVRTWLAVHTRSLVVLGVLLPPIAVMHGWNMYRWPAINITDDEGTYVSQAWAVGTWHQLGHYTYWYDHPPLGWIQIAGYAWLTEAWSRAPYSVAVGREFMLLVDVVACALVFVLARRLSLGRWSAAAAMVLFAASPLSLHYHRMVYLDNIATMWILAALVFAASRRRSLASAAGSAVCVAVAVLSKETVALLAPFVCYLLWQHSDVRTRRYRVTTFLTTATALTLFYPLYALLKDELLEGPGHVSLLWAIRWQLTLRASNGSIFDPGTGAGNHFESWLRLDPWLLLAGLVLAVPALAIPRLRPLALALLLQAVMILRPGYVPQAYIVAMLPLAALVVAGAANHLARLRPARPVGRVARPVAGVALACGAIALAPVWVRGDLARLTGGTDVPTKQAVAWVKDNVGDNQHIVVDSNVWLDLVRAGYDPNPPHWEVIWVYKVGTDPSVKLPPGLHAVDYFVYAMDPMYAAHDAPQIVAPYRHSRVVATFGSEDNRITVRKVLR